MAAYRLACWPPSPRCNCLQALPGLSKPWARAVCASQVGVQPCRAWMALVVVLSPPELTLLHAVLLLVPCPLQLMLMLFMHLPDSHLLVMWGGCLPAGGG